MRSRLWGVGGVRGRGEGLVVVVAVWVVVVGLRRGGAPPLEAALGEEEVRC